jgi:multiple sugar transport system permease protein
LPLIVPDWLSTNALWIFLLRQFFRSIPMELSEAARIDGAGELRIWWQIVMPLVTPALAFVGISAFTAAWQDFQKPLIYLSTENNFVLQLGLIVFKASGGGVPQWHYLMAASVVVMLPVLVLFFLGQRYFTEGVALTGIKG